MDKGGEDNVAEGEVVKKYDCESTTSSAQRFRDPNLDW